MTRSASRTARRRAGALAAAAAVAVGLAAAGATPTVGAPVIAVLAVAYVGHHGRQRVLQEREVWQHLEATNQEMGGLDEREIAEVAIIRAATLLEADEVELWLRGEGDVDEVHVGDAQGSREIRTEPRLRADRFAVTTYRSSIGLAPEETCVMVPLVGRQAQLGVLCLRFRAHVELRERERRLLGTYGNALTSNLDNARLYAAVRAQAARHEKAARHDPLTGLANRLALGEQAERVVSRPDASFAVLLLDLDRFKQVNDLHGHAAGDRLLCAVADRMTSAVRPSDLVARLGGDEFAVLLADPRAADATVERLQQLLAEPVDIGATTVSVGASIGAARFPADATAWDALLEHADAAMYADKEAGRDRVVELPCVPVPVVRGGQDRFVVLS